MRTFAWSVLLVALLLWATTWILSQIWGWLLIILLCGGALRLLVVWLRSRRNRW
ncbi:hypothetical protein LQ938_11445 [Microbacterium sp. cx-55]|uniref:hypothetical protein n=1 Tax=Microbacterium sp. cx-55 TaxID=2875948 RepID=UPI001CBF247B|nr:hypothetical protein [Microbacterium sp. cx-55]MBZ4488110.1 hypothetical protein [Microbacterium sp. cx-55]UGB34481.1 hypothetical protein LQ938_11445 [Microbacterium sp. cx-55]